MRHLSRVLENLAAHMQSNSVTSCFELNVLFPDLSPYSVTWIMREHRRRVGVLLMKGNDVVDHASARTVWEAILKIARGC